ncbi:FtsQ-type POTRA domain-containing protein [Marinomonas agarivorans]|nr:FtsQ-type POTRA domain-containing protein [Marinomonas agarivorans]
MRLIAFLGACLLFLLAFLQGEAESRGWFTVVEVQIEGEPNYLTTTELSEAYGDIIGMSLLFSSLQDIMQITNKPAWVQTTEIRKIWPNKILVKVKEHVPLAYWGDNEVITKFGVVIKPNQLPQEDLPRLSGPEGSNSMVLEQFRLVSQVLALSNLQMTKLELEERGAWNVYFSQGLLVKLGRDEILERLQRFVAVYKSDLSGRIKNIEQVDARYSHGIAVTWKSPAN